jgi:lipooligosaccharide transport system permease protein
MSTPAAVRAWEQHWVMYRSVWKSNVMASFVQPLLYLLGMGLGVGALVDRNDSADVLLDGLTYFQFLAPALIATTAMMIGTNEGMWPVLGGFKWWYAFHAKAATPLGPSDIASGVTLWQATKSGIAAGAVAAVLVVFPETRSWGLVPAALFGTLTGLAFATPMTAWSATRERDWSFPTINRFIIMPLFLFGGAFYPISQLPDWMEPIAQATPLWHGVELCRDAVHERLELVPTLAHVGYLTALTVIGWALSVRSFGRRLQE